METICIVEDRKSIREHYESYLTEKGYEVVSYKNRMDALAGWDLQSISLFILDIVLDGELQGGYMLANYIRSKISQVPIVFLTDDPKKELEGLNRNVNDFIVKGYDEEYMAKFYARISNHIRMYKEHTQLASQDNSHQSTIVHNGDLLINVARNSVNWKHQKLAVSGIELMLLYYLASNPERPVSYKEIVKFIDKPTMENSVLQVHISNIRKRFKEIDDQFQSIKNIPKVGYMWK